MALHAEKKNTSTPEVEQQTTQSYTATENQTQTAGANATDANFFQNQITGFGGKLDIIRQASFKPLGGGAVHEKISRIHQLFTSVYEEKKKMDPSVMDVRFIIAPPSKIGNLYGGIIVAIPTQTNKGIAVGTHLMVVENSTKPQPQSVQFNGVHYTVHNTASNTVTAETVQACSALTEQSLKLPGAEIIDAGFTIIPEEVTVNDEATLKNLLDNAAGAALTRLQLHTGNIESDIAYVLADAIRSNEVSVYANIEENPLEQTDIAMQPIRSDFKITTIASQNATQNAHTEQAIEIGSVNVFCSPVYTQPQVQYTPQGMVQPTRSYFNQIVIRDLKTGPEIRLSTANLFMLMATTGLLAQAGLWKRAYTPNMHIAKGQLDLKDIGAFGYEVPQMSPNGRPELVDTKTSEFDTQTFNRYMTALFHDEVIYQVDVPDGHYLLNVLLAEANGSQVARDIVHGVINGLTNGVFATLYPNTEQMFYNTDIRVINGYYTDGESGKTKPLDNLDHLALLNMVQGDAHSMQEFESSFGNTRSSALKLAIRTAMLEELTSNNMKVRSYSTRLTINPKFMEALINALRTHKLFPEITSRFAQQQTYSRPTMDFYSRYAVNPNHIPNLFAGYGNPHQHYGATQVMQPYYGAFR